MQPQPRSDRAPSTSLRFGKSIAVALLVAACLFALVLALGSPSPQSVGAHPCATGTPEDMHEDFQARPVPCSAPTHQDIHEHTIEVDGGRDRELVFKAYVPENIDDFDDADDRIVIKFHRSFDLPASLHIGAATGDPKITIAKNGLATPTPVDITDPTMALCQ